MAPLEAEYATIWMLVSTHLSSKDCLEKTIYLALVDRRRPPMKPP